MRRASGGRLHVDFDPDTFIAGDDDSEGHQIMAWHEFDGDSDEIMYVDDRLPDLRGQMVDELNRVAEIYLTTAEKLAAAKEGAL